MGATINSINENILQFCHGEMENEKMSQYIINKESIFIEPPSYAFKIHTDNVKRNKFQVMPYNLTFLISFSFCIYFTDLCGCDCSS